MAKKPSVFVEKEISEMYGRMAREAAKNAILFAKEGAVIQADSAAQHAARWARVAGGNVIRHVVLG